MPYSLRKVRNKELYKVYNTDTGKIHSKATSLENAKKQIKLLYMVDAGVTLKKGKGSGASRIRPQENIPPQLTQEEIQEIERRTNDLINRTRPRLTAEERRQQEIRQLRNSYEETLQNIEYYENEISGFQRRMETSRNPDDLRRIIQQSTGRRDYYINDANNILIRLNEIDPRSRIGTPNARSLPTSIAIPYNRDDFEIGDISIVDGEYVPIELDNINRSSSSSSNNSFVGERNLDEEDEIQMRNYLREPSDTNISGGSIKKIKNKWIEHVKKYATKKGIKYNEALKDPKCKSSY